MTENALLRALHDAAKEIAHPEDEADIARAAAEHATRALSADASILLLARTDAPTSFVPVAAWPHSGDTNLPVLEDLEVDVHCIVRAERPLQVVDMEGPDPNALASYAGYAFAPLEIAGRLLGLLGVKREAEPLNNMELELLCALASVTSAATESSRSFREVTALKTDLELQVEERTRELSSALSELKEAQACMVESENQAMLGRLAAGIVHELNSPLGTLRSAVDSIIRALEKARVCATACAADGNPEAKDVLRAIGVASDVANVAVRSNERIDAVLAALTRFVSLDEAAFKPLDVRTVIEDVLRLLTPKLAAGAKVRREYPQEVPRVPCYPAKLNQVFLNILDNAITATRPTGTIDIRVSVANRSHVLVQIADDGHGIRPEQMATLFDFGFTQKRGRMALSLGLPLSKRYLEEIGGSLDIESTEGVGTTVTVTLPTRPSESPENESTS